MEKKNLKVAKVNITPNKIFSLMMPLNENFALKGEKVEDSYMWHLRYAHLNYKHEIAKGEKYGERASKY